MEAAQLAFSVRLKHSTNASENTKNTQAIARAWQSPADIRLVISVALESRGSTDDMNKYIVFMFQLCLCLINVTSNALQERNCCMRLAKANVSFIS